MIAGFITFLLSIADLFAYKFKSPIAGYLEGWLFIFIETLALLFLLKYYFSLSLANQISKKQTIGIGMGISLCFSLTWAIFSFLFIKFVYPKYETEMINYLYNPSPSASAAETTGMYLSAQLSANAYFNSVIKMFSGLVIGAIVSVAIVFTRKRKNVNNNLTRDAYF